MKRVRSKAYAKVNLTLDVLGSDGGMHSVESLVCSVDVHDAVTVQSRRDGRVTVSMRGLSSESVEPERNNAYIAAERFVSRYGTDGADIRIDKNIPLGAGLGGSSADAAAVLRSMAEIFGVDDEEGLFALASECGSDTAYMLRGGYAVMSGKGETVTPVDSDMRLDLLLCLPPFSVSTEECYARYDRLGVRTARRTGEALKALLAGDREALGRSLSNGLFPAARTLREDIAGIYGMLLSLGPCGVNMTGSGSCVYALCENDQYMRYFASRMNFRGRMLQVRTVIPKNTLTTEE